MTGGRGLGVVLAGGAGTRVRGADKGLLPLHGRPLISHVLESVRPQCDAMLIVANRNHDAYSRFASTIRDGQDGHAGPLAGLIAAITFVQRDAAKFDECAWLLTLPVDCPSPPRDLRERLQSALAAADAACAFARDDVGAQPLFALYRISRSDELLRTARAALSSHASVTQWHRGIDARAVDFPERPEAFRNLNTPEEFREYEAAHV